jgi:pilus assembly protein CpaE
MAEKVLIVDDDLETLRLVGRMLQKQGYQILAADSGKQAIEIARSDLPDLIILDVMMPDIDGYEVTKLLRKEPVTSMIPILMFTAKTQVNDKVAGYEAGVDDYLTKPIHPAELVAHVKSLLARSHGRQISPTERGYMIGFLSTKGGCCLSTLVLNLSILLREKLKTDITAVELRPGHGSWGIDLGLPKSEGLIDLLKLKPEEITPAMIENQLTRTPYGVRLLLSSNHLHDLAYTACSEQIEMVLHQIKNLSPLILVDIGCISLPNTEKIISQCDELMIVTEPIPSSIHSTRMLMDDLAEMGYGKNKLLTIVLSNRVSTDVKLSVTHVQEMLGQPVTQIIPPAPEQAYQAVTRNLPMVNVQPEGFVSMQYHKLADSILPRVRK